MDATSISAACPIEQGMTAPSRGGALEAPRPCPGRRGRRLTSSRPFEVRHTAVTQLTILFTPQAASMSTLNRS